jgi:hypothetical protein
LPIQASGCISHFRNALLLSVRLVASLLAEGN